ncbi:hypothetical protein OEZ86_011702 [Tetradesmus obliquus]|nr:hypothetical protein OEZ86_011702 [Tetradesmus obliquus]
MLSGITFGDRSALEREEQQAAQAAQAAAAAAAAARKKEKKRLKKEKKKHKKDKSKKQKDKGHGSSGGEPSSGSGSDDEQQQGGTPAAAAAGNGAAGAAAVQREDWMTVPMASSAAFAQQPAKQQAKPAEPEEAPIVSGIRYMDPKQEAAAAERAAAREAAAAAAGPDKAAAAGGAAGVSWRMRALQRAQQLAQEQGRGLNEVLTERWGSAADIAKGIIDGAAAAAAGRSNEPQHGSRGSAPDSRQQQQRGERSSGGATPHYLAGLRSEKGEMRRPAGISSGNKLSWRRPGPAAAAAAGDGDGGGRGQEQAEQRRGDREGGADRRQGGGSGRERDAREEQQERPHGDRGHDRQQQDSRDRGDGRDRGYDRDRGHGRDRDRQDERGRDRRRERERERGYDGDRDSKDRQGRQQQAGERRQPAGGRGGQQLRREQQQQEVVEALKAVAGSINTFKNDGSFMQQMMAPAAAAAAEPSSDGKQRQVMVLPQVDARGRAMPGAFGREAAGDGLRAAEAAAGGRMNKRVQRYGADGTRERYFADDDSVDLQTLVKRAKHGDDSVGDLDRTLAGNIARRQKFKETDLDADAEYDHDAGLELSESRAKRGNVEQQRQRERQRQVAQFNKQQRLEDSCAYCFSSPSRPKKLAIAVGQSTYLSLVQRGRLVEGHCVIAPAEHVASIRQVDEATWTEVRNFQKCLIRMFMEQGKEVLFLETATGLGSHRNHALLEAIPMPPDAFSKAPMYFKKALQEAESEWAQHAAKAVIDTKAKGLRGSIPPNFPYLYVQFGYANGFVHVIDDEAKFDKQLGRQVVVGLLRLPPEVMHRRQRADAPSVQAGMAAAFRKQFAPYDWTKALE